MGYDLETLAHAEVDADFSVRLIKSRVVYRGPNSTLAVVGHACMASRFVWLTSRHMAGRSVRRPWTTRCTAPCRSMPGPIST
jgi:hypothetical protein